MQLAESLITDISNDLIEENGLDLSSQELSDDDIEKLVESLKNNTHIQYLVLSYNNIGDKRAKALASLTNIKSLDLAVNQIGPEGAKFLARGKFETLSLSGNYIGNEGIAAFRDNATLLRLEADECGIGTEGIKQLLTNNTKLVELKLKGNHLTDLGIAALPENSKLEILDLSFNSINLQSIKCLVNNFSLKILGLSSNYLKANIIQAIALGQNQLEALDLSNTQIGDACVALNNCKLVFLFLSSNKITSDGVIPLFNNKHLVNLELSFNLIDDKCVDAIVGNTTLHHIGLMYNKIKAQGVKKILNVTHIPRIELKGNSGFTENNGSPTLKKPKNNP